MALKIRPINFGNMSGGVSFRTPVHRPRAVCPCF